MVYGCKLTGITDFTSNSLSEMLPLDQELRSGNSSFISNTSVEECKHLCKSKKGCSVASINEEKICYHYIGSELGIWKNTKITNGSQWFSKLQNNVSMVSFPPRAYQKESFFRNVQYIDGVSIITSLSYPLTAILDNDILWIVNFAQGRFAKFVFTNVSLSECELIVKTSEDGNKGFSIDTRYNDNVFVLETDKNLLFLSAMPHTTTLTPRMKFRAIVTAEDTPACFSLDLNGFSNIRQELCNKPSMFLTSLSYLYHPLKSEEFAIQAGKHQTIDITFIDLCIACFRYEGSGKFLLIYKSMLLLSLFLFCINE
ncbi:uncharacterized protein LOC132750625 [Ruditapes philippinarum]|uniref:uncharacterized protein LOC132750625 n=1 Tax=Ruditapes philippinarum TaxID=129788 RepID=UPI00295B7411|nr:uncharacterized protein LOC132750625 [Ruditapes philippinarum]